MMDHFFDCSNVRNTKEHLLKRKEFLRPYNAKDDERFSWLLQTFLGYLKDWKKSTDQRSGDQNSAAKAKMFISWQTYEGIQIICNSLVECFQYLLDSGCQYVLSERFCQDDLENYFGKQRAIGSRRDNPSVRDVGYDDNVIKSQFSVAPISSNSMAQNKWNIIDNSPLPKRKEIK